ncbi:VWA domain-containing protein [Arcobacter aquimarinus]|uniref:VWA domain-containing protein n=1 Tax=Arcobacter aquimarinus TaxID=1315211 RepID=UPI0039EA897B
MKLTIKSDNQVKIIDLNKDLELSAVKGEQYVFSNGFTSYTLNFKDDQQTVSLQFNVDGKVIKIDLKGIVPFLQENSSEIENPTAIIINKTINEGSIDNVIQNDAFNGSEIIDKLEALITNPVDLGKDLTLISDFQTLIEALDAAAAGGEQGTSNTNASSFNSIFSPLEDSLNDIGETDIWENLSESISSVPVDTGTPIGIVSEITPIINVNIKLFPVKVDVIEGENAIYKLTLTDDEGNPIIAIEDIEVTFRYTYITASGDDIIEVKSVIIPAGSSEITFEVETINDNIYEITEEFTIEIETVSNQEQFDSVVIDNTPILTVINDEDDNNPDTPDVPTDGDKPVVSIVATDAVATEGPTDTATFTISQTNTSNFDTKVKVTLNLTEITKEDISKVEYTDANGNTVTLTSSQIDALVAGTFEVVIPKGSTGTPSFTFTATDDDIYEISEGFGLSISNAENATLGTSSATAVINDEDDNNPDTPDVPTDGDKPVVSIVATDAVATEGPTDTATFTISQTNTSNFDTKVKVTLNLTEITKEDISKVEYTDANGNTVTLTSSQIDALVAGTFEVVIPKGSTGTPSFTFTATDDDIYEISEGFGLSISNAENATLGTSSATAVINDEDDNNPDTPDVPTDGDKPILIITGSIVEEKESGISTGEKVLGTVEISISNGKFFTEDLNITLSTGQVVTIKAGETTTGPINVETNRIDDYYKQGTTTYDVSIQEVSNSKIDITGKTATITINDDVDPIGIEITATATAPKIIDVNTEFNDLTGVKISATDTDGNLKNISVVTGTNHDGFGVEGNTTGSGASSELGNLGNGKSEKLIFEFDKDINSLDVAFAWRHNGETARITFINDGNIVGYAEVKGGGSNTKAKVNYYTPDGELIRSVEAQGGTDRVDLSYTFELVNNDGSLGTFDQVEFTAPNHDDDYLINKITYKEVLNPEIIDVSADNGSVTFDVQLQHPPQGNATAKIEVNGVIYNNVVINATGRATLTVDGKDLGDLSNVVIKVLEINGGNYEKVNSVEKTFDFTPVLKSTDDSMITNEDETYTLKVTDFGEVSVNTKEFKITELPNLESGKLYLLVKEGETIIDKEGNISVATQDTKIEIFENQIIKLADVGAEKVIFEPKINSDIDGSFKFEVGDGNGKFSDEYTTVIKINAVSDTPTTSIDAVKLSSGEYTVEINAALRDIDGSETLTVKISNVPNGAELSSTKYEVTKNSDGSWNVKVPAGSTSISDTLVMNNVPQGTDWVNLKITATATEKNDNNDGKNFAIAEANDSTVHSVGESDQVCMESFKYNIMITLDNSGSMRGDKITLAKTAMVNLVNKYTDLGEVRVTLNVFNQYGEIKGLWVTPAEAISLIDQITASGGTNYDDALLKNIDTLSKNPAPLDGKTISYFVSDGQPTYKMVKNSNGEWNISGNGSTTESVTKEIADQFKNLNIDESYAIGIGTSELNTHLNNITDDVTVISDANQLSDTLEGTIQELIYEGTVADNISGGDVKVKIDTIVIDGKTYTKDTFPINGVITGDNKIKLTFNFETGEYKYYAKSSKFSVENVGFKVNASDVNGDTTTFDVGLKVSVISEVYTPVTSIDVRKISSFEDINEIVAKVGNKTYNISDILNNKGSYTELKNIGNNTTTSATNIIVNENLDNNDFLKASSADNIIVINANLNGNAKIEPMGGNDFIAILGDLKGYNNTLNDSAGKDTLFLGKASTYYSWNINTHSGETGLDGTITQYSDKDKTQVIGTLVINNIDGVIFADGKTIGNVTIEKNISTLEYEVDFSAALKTGTDGVLSVKISNVPEGASFNLQDIKNLGNGVWEVIVPAGAKSIDYNNIKMIVPEGTKYVDLKITATASSQAACSLNNVKEAIDSDATLYAVSESEQAKMNSFKYNLVLTIDNSGSMKGDKITLAKTAMVNLVNKYTELGEVKVFLTTFSNTAEIKGVWVDSQTAINLINNISTKNMTNYDDALLKVINTMNSTPVPYSDGKSVSYFVSDGQPNYGMKQDSNGEWVLNTSANGVNQTLSTQFKSLDIDKSYAIGIGTSSLNTHLNAVSNDVTIISNATQLSQTLEDTVQELLVEGNFLDNVIGGDGKITADTITFEGTVYTKDTFPINGIVSGDNHIKLTVDFETGEYKYYAKSSKFTEEIKVFTVEASDNNGDKVKYDIEAEVKVINEKAENVQQLTGEDIDLSKVITKTTDVIDMENSDTSDKLKVELQDILDLNNKELIIKGDLGDIVELDKPATDWVKGQTQQIDGKNYNVYTNATVKLLIEDDIDVIPDI